MLGAARSALSSSFTAAGYFASVSPTSIHIESRNGAATTPSVTVTTTGSVGPLTYLWVVDNERVTINSDTEAVTTFTSGGYDEPIEAIATITVTDTGNGNLETESTINLTFAFGI